MSGIATASLLPDPPRRRHDEEDLQRQVCQFLKFALPPEGIYFSVPNGAKRHHKAAAKLVATGLRAGIPDLVVGYRGRIVFLELKTPAGHASAAQRQMWLRLVQCGFEVCCCRSLPEVEASLREACIPLRASCHA